MVAICPKLPNRDFVVCYSSELVFYNSSSSKLTKKLTHKYNSYNISKKCLISNGKAVAFSMNRNLIIVSFYNRNLLWTFDSNSNFGGMKCFNSGKHLVVGYLNKRAVEIKDIRFLGLISTRSFGVQTDDLEKFTLEDIIETNGHILNRQFLKKSEFRWEDSDQNRVIIGTTKKVKTSEAGNGVLSEEDPWTRDFGNRTESSQNEESSQEEESKTESNQHEGSSLEEESKLKDNLGVFKESKQIEGKNLELLKESKQIKGKNLKRMGKETESNEDMKKYWMGKDNDVKFDESKFYSNQIKVKFIRIWNSTSVNGIRAHRRNCSK